ncbi:MAG: hypothetical protein Q7K45_03460 [Nanoarchaeota archaeon]|nr:hypothetical protein [Nanoarchaeota archaeon]
MDECQEPRCTNPSTKKWGGRRVCQDHYDHYQDIENKNIHDMQDAY